MRLDICPQNRTLHTFPLISTIFNQAHFLPNISPCVKLKPLELPKCIYSCCKSDIPAPWSWSVSRILSGSVSSLVPIINPSWAQMTITTVLPSLDNISHWDSIRSNVIIGFQIKRSSASLI